MIGPPSILCYVAPFDEPLGLTTTTVLNPDPRNSQFSNHIEVSEVSSDDSFLLPVLVIVFLTPSYQQY